MIPRPANYNGTSTTDVKTDHYNFNRNRSTSMQSPSRSGPFQYLIKLAFLTIVAKYVVIRVNLQHTMYRNTIQGERFRPQESKQRAKENIAFRHAIQSSNTNLKKISMSKWHHIENQPLLREIYKEKPIIPYKKGKSLKDILVRAKLEKKRSRHITP